MQFIIIKKSGKLIKQDDKGKKKEKISKLSDSLGLEVKFEEGLKLETLFKMILKEKDFFNILFKQELKDTTLEEIGKQLKKKQNKPEIEKENEDGDVIKSLEIVKMFELLSFEQGNTIDLFTILIGIGINEDEPGEIYMPVGLISINNLKGLELTVNKAVEIFKSRYDSAEEEEIGDLSKQSVLVAASSITLYEALQSIIYEVAFFGTSEEKTKQLKKQKEEYKTEDQIESLERYLIELVEQEEYEKAAKIKQRLDILKK